MRRAVTSHECGMLQARSSRSRDVRGVAEHAELRDRGAMIIQSHPISPMACVSSAFKTPTEHPRIRQTDELTLTQRVRG